MRKRPRHARPPTDGRLTLPPQIHHRASPQNAGQSFRTPRAAQVRLRGGARLSSPALVADGKHARIDGFVSLGVIGSAIIVALGFPRGDPIIGLVITLVILRITWDAWRTVSRTEPGEMVSG
jgi:hypothetical protein